MSSYRDTAATPYLGVVTTPSNAASRRALLLLMRVGAFAAIAVGAARIADTVAGADARNDFAHYYLSARMLLEGENPYTTPLAPRCEALGFEQDPRIPYGANPPLLIRSMACIAWAPPGAAYLAWLLTQVGCLVGLALVLRRLTFQGGDGTWQLVGLAVLVNSSAVMTHFYYSQVQLPVALAIAGAVLLRVRGRTASAMALATAAAAFKLYPAVLLPWFLLSGLRGWGDLAKRVAAAAAVGLAALAVTGPEMWLSFVQEGLPVIQLSVGGSWTNYSLPSLAKMLSGAVAGDLASPPAWSAPLGKLLGLLAIAAAYGRVLYGGLKPAAEASLLCLAMMAASLVCWSHYFVLAALPAAVLTAGARGRGPRAMLVAAPLAVLLLWPELDAATPFFQPLAARVLLHFYPLAVMGLAAWMIADANSAEIEKKPQYEQ
ncbi:hypothetical protein Pla175_47560 [Pirellulimonas nuda]|uniref:Polyprenol-phosphate-mannose-dependent alpha-(1-2)-phosphatidylinositol mannoside mannosyltransferase n=1 Tax=Pirellulimonas nuda TaxID=2528009 RepID=A0A518DIN7_9BACT|nr:glycosyltransferase family 87 protein [Pirellulimonas nuda]QDU91335.1 hypothetical protein Pla175_47560 [Pirellulimonas nuda]